jgi:hypothetical protein
MNCELGVGALLACARLMGNSDYGVRNVERRQRGAREMTGGVRFERSQ